MVYFKSQRTFIFCLNKKYKAIKMIILWYLVCIHYQRPKEIQKKGISEKKEKDSFMLIA